MRKSGGEDRPFEGGAQPVAERRPEVATKGRTALQVVVLVAAALVLLAAILWILVPLFG